MQATATAPEVTARALAAELSSFVVYLHKTGNSEIFRAVAELDLSLTQIKALHILDRVDDAELSLKELGERIGVSLPAASRTVEGLHQRGLVVRHEDVADRRMKRVRLTDAGREVTRQMHAGRLSHLESIAASLTPAQRRQLSDALAPVLARPELTACRIEHEGTLP